MMPLLELGVGLSSLEAQGYMEGGGTWTKSGLWWERGEGVFALVPDTLLIPELLIQRQRGGLATSCCVRGNDVMQLNLRWVTKVYFYFNKDMFILMYLFKK